MPGSTGEFEAREVGRAALVVALVASVVVHAGMFFFARSAPDHAPLSASSAEVPASVPTSIEWSGTTSMVPGGEKLYDVSLNGSPDAPSDPLGTKLSAPAAPAAVAAPAAPVETKPAPNAQVKPEAQAEPKLKKQPEARHEQPPAPAPALAKAAEPKRPPPVDAPEPDKSAASEPPPKKAKSSVDPYEALDAKPAGPSSTSKEPVAAASHPASDGAPPPSPAGSDAKAAGAGASETGGGGSFGAVGKAGVRDLGRAFTQAIPPACDSDPLWSKAAIGSVGSIRIALDVDETGHISGFTPLVEDPPKVLLNMARRTVSMLQAGTFALRSGAVSAGRQTIEISAVTSDVEPPEGNTITLSQDFDGAVGKASFTQPNGRHVELKIKVIRVEVSAAPSP